MLFKAYRVVNWDLAARFLARFASAPGQSSRSAYRAALKQFALLILPGQFPLDSPQKPDIILSWLNGGLFG